MGSNKNLVGDMNKVDLSPEEIESARIAHCEILEGSIKDLEVKEQAAKKRLAAIDDEINSAYKVREDAVKNIESIASRNYIAAKTKVNEANDLFNSADEKMKLFEKERSVFLIDKEKILSEIRVQQEALSDKQSALVRAQAKIDARLKNVEARESLLHKEG